MPVLTKAEHRRLSTELVNRIAELRRHFDSRELKNNLDGCKKGRWLNPDNLCATKGSASELRLALADFKAILDEISKLK